MRRAGPSSSPDAGPSAAARPPSPRPPRRDAVPCSASRTRHAGPWRHRWSQPGWGGRAHPSETSANRLVWGVMCRFAVDPTVWAAGGVMGQRRLGQASLAEALLPAGVGCNRRLERIGGLIDWARMERLLAPLRAPTGRPGYPPLALFRALLLAQRYRLSDPGLEEALADRLSFRRFCGLGLDDGTPDETTLCRFTALRALPSARGAQPLRPVRRHLIPLPRIPSACGVSRSILRRGKVRQPSRPPSRRRQSALQAAGQWRWPAGAEGLTCRRDGKGPPPFGPDHPAEAGRIPGGR